MFMSEKSNKVDPMTVLAVKVGNPLAARSLILGLVQGEPRKLKDCSETGHKCWNKAHWIIYHPFPGHMISPRTDKETILRVG